jgi:hypothetical protein
MLVHLPLKVKAQGWLNVGPISQPLRDQGKNAVAIGAVADGLGVG